MDLRLGVWLGGFAAFIVTLLTLLPFASIAKADALFAWDKDGVVNSFDSNTLALTQSLTIEPQNCCSSLNAAFAFGNGNIYALVPQYQGGSLLRFSLNGQLLGSANTPVLNFGDFGGYGISAANGLLYAWDMDGLVQAFNPTTMQLVQSFVLGPQNCCHSAFATFAFGNNDIYELLPQNQGGTLLHFDRNGRLLGSTTTSPLDFGSTGAYGVGLANGLLYAWDMDGTVTAYDPTTMALRQSLVVGPQNCCGSVFATFAFGNSDIYELVPQSQGGLLLRFDITGQPLGSANIPPLDYGDIGGYGIGVPVSEVPEPSAMLLFATGLSFFALWRSSRFVCRVTGEPPSAQPRSSSQNGYHLAMRWRD